MTEKQGDGETLQVHLQKMISSPFSNIEAIETAKQSLEVPPLPPVAQYLIQLFHRAQRRRPNYGMGISPIDFQEFYSRRGITLVGFEISILEALDELVINHANAKAQKDTDKIKETTKDLPAHEPSPEPRSPYA